MLGLSRGSTSGHLFLRDADIRFRKYYLFPFLRIDHYLIIKRLSLIAVTTHKLMATLSAIPIKTPYIDLILAGYKTWEIRSKFTKKIGPVALVRSGSGTVVGIATLSDVIKLSTNIAFDNMNKIGIRSMSRETANYYDGKYAWVLTDIIKLNTPVPYAHPSGAITWVTLDKSTTSKVLLEAKRSPKVKNMQNKS